MSKRELVITNPTLADEAEAIRELVRHNEPHHRNPEHFHERKSEITLRLTLLAETLRTGRPLESPNDQKPAPGPGPRGGHRPSHR